MTNSKKVYLAADLLCAFLDRTHAKHDQAAAFFRFFSVEEYQLYTDSINLYDAYRRIYTDMSPSVAKEFLRTIYISSINVLYPDEGDMKAALKLYLNDKSAELTMDKAIMAYLADRKSIPQIATFEYLHTLFGLTIFYIPL